MQIGWWNVCADFSWVVQNDKVKKNYFSDLCFASEGKYEFLLLRKLLPCWSGSGCCTALTPDTKNMETFSFEKNWGVGNGMMKILAVTRLTTRKWKPSASKGTCVYDLG